MLPAVISAFFKFKLVSNIIVLTCSGLDLDRVKFTRHLSEHGMSSTFSCDPGILKDIRSHRFQGVLYFEAYEVMLKKVKPEHFAHWYKWLIITDNLPNHINTIRYDSDITYIRAKSSLSKEPVFLEDVYVHPSRGGSIHPWASWTQASGLQVDYNNERTSRRLNFDKYPLKIVSPLGYYSPSVYNGSFTRYLQDDVAPERDSAIRCSFLASSMIIEMLNASVVLLETQYWSSLTTNDSVVSMVQNQVADLSGAILRILPDRIETMDYILPIWPFSVGFTYLAERESSSNMYVEPFTAGVWWTCLGIGLVLAASQRVTARKLEEKEGALIGVLATWLQQDASAVPEGLSGRWSFVVMSVSAMLVHAYYTSAIVSSLMSTGRGGPSSLRALGDSRYAIVSEDYDYMKYLFWEVETKWTDLEYLKKRKMKLSSLYADMETGTQLIREGNTAYHTEYNRIYPYFNTMDDDQLCKLQYLPTISEVLTWTTTTKRGQYTEVFRTRGAWLRESGLAQRVVSRLRMRPPPCRAALLAERVKFGDIAPLLTITSLGVVLSCIILGVEIAYAKSKKDKPAEVVNTDDVVVINYID